MSVEGLKLSGQIVQDGVTVQSIKNAKSSQNALCKLSEPKFQTSILFNPNYPEVFSKQFIQGGGRRNYHTP